MRPTSHKLTSFAPAFCALSLSILLPHASQSNVKVDAGDTWEDFFDCASMIAGASGAALDSSGSYCISDSSERESRAHCTKGGFATFAADGEKVTIPAGGKCEGAWDGVIGISISTAVGAYADGWFEPTDTGMNGLFKFPPNAPFEAGHSGAYACGIMSGVLIHEISHEAIQDYLVSNCGMTPEQAQGSDCAEVLAKLAALHAMGIALESLEAELEEEQNKVPPDQGKIDDLKAEIEGLEKVIEKEIDDLNADPDGDGTTWGQEALNKCPANCDFNSPTFPIGDVGDVPNPIPQD